MRFFLALIVAATLAGCGASRMNTCYVTQAEGDKLVSWPFPCRVGTDI